jgi:hypothetical protein
VRDVSDQVRTTRRVTDCTLAAHGAAEVIQN